MISNVSPNGSRGGGGGAVGKVVEARRVPVKLGGG